MNNLLTDQNHGYENPDIPIGRQFPVNRPVSIGSGSWLGAGAIVLPGAQVGRNVVIAVGSVVRGVIPDRCVVAGVPARIIRRAHRRRLAAARAEAQGPGLRPTASDASKWP
jgi:acetyltransferase-like isoleucine patch superfamily enzyme